MLSKIPHFIKFNPWNKRASLIQLVTMHPSCCTGTKPLESSSSTLSHHLLFSFKKQSGLCGPRICRSTHRLAMSWVSSPLVHRTVSRSQRHRESQLQQQQLPATSFFCSNFTAISEKITTIPNKPFIVLRKLLQRSEVKQGGPEAKVFFQTAGHSHL